MQSAAKVTLRKQPEPSSDNSNNMFSMENPRPVDWERYAAHPNFHGAYQNPAIFSRAVKGASGTFVDVGAGDGSTLRNALDTGDLVRFQNIYAFDVSNERVNRMLRLVPEAKAAVGDAQRVPLPDESIDFYYSNQVIEHVPDDRAMASEILRLLKPGGRGFVGSVVKARGAWYFYRCNGQWRCDPTHLREYESLDQYAALFRSVGLNVVEAVLEPMVFPLTDLAMRVLLRLGLVKTDDVLGAYQRYPLLKHMAMRKVRVPRYFLCYAIVQKPE